MKETNQFSRVSLVFSCLTPSSTLTDILTTPNCKMEQNWLTQSLSLRSQIQAKTLPAGILSKSLSSKLRTRAGLDKHEYGIQGDELHNANEALSALWEPQEAV